MTQPPIAIIITFGREMIRHNGGLHAFLNSFRWNMDKDDGLWYHKNKNLPTQEVAWAYIIIENRVYCRVNVVQYSRNTQGVHSFRATGEECFVTWPMIVLAGPVIKAPRKIEMRGFQYVTEELW